MKLYNYLLIVFLLFLDSTNSLSQSLNWNAINSENSTLVTGNVNGCNMGGYAFGRITIQSDNINVADECNQCSASFLCELPLSGPSFSSMETKPNVLAQTIKLNPSVLRFPGGTHSGWYHLYDYDNEGMYDASAPVIDKGYGMTLIETAHLNNPMSYCKMDSRNTTDQNYIDAFTNYVNNIQNGDPESSKIKVTYVANLLTHFRFQSNQAACVTCSRSKAVVPMSNFNCDEAFDLPYVGNEALFNNDQKVYRFELYYKETQDAIENIVTALSLEADDDFYVEMGNEYYLAGGYPYLKYEMGADDYAKLVETYSERLKCYFSDKINIKVGIVTNPNTPWQVELIKNLNLDLDDNGESFNEAVDAVIYHTYYNSDKCLDENNIETRFDCAKDALRNFIESDVHSDLDNFKSNFPDQKVWITEWNLLGGDENKNNSFLNTILHAAFVQEFALNLLEYNASNDNLIEMSTHHRLGEHNVWSVIQTRDGDNEIANYRSGAYALQFISKLNDSENKNFVGNILTDENGVFDTKDAKASAFLQHGENDNSKLLVYYSNKLSTPIEYNIPESIDGDRVDSAKVSYLTGDRLFTYGPRNLTAGRNQFKESANVVHFNESLDELGYGFIDDQFLSVSDSSVNHAEMQHIPGNSIGVLEVFYSGESSSTKDVTSSDFYIDIYPNPANELVNIQFDSVAEDDVQVSLINTAGMEVMRVGRKVVSGLNNFQLNISEIPSGVYFALIKTSGGVAVEKVVLNR